MQWALAVPVRTTHVFTRFRQKQNRHVDLAKWWPVGIPQGGFMKVRGRIWPEFSLDFSSHFLRHQSPEKMISFQVQLWCQWMNVFCTNKIIINGKKKVIQGHSMLLMVSLRFLRKSWRRLAVCRYVPPRTDCMFGILVCFLFWWLRCSQKHFLFIGWWFVFIAQKLPGTSVGTLFIDGSFSGEQAFFLLMKTLSWFAFRCNSECNTCEGPSAKECTGCQPGFLLIQGSCLPQCNPGNGFWFSISAETLVNCAVKACLFSLVDQKTFDLN